jgi:iron complex outermembrane receptor protein
LPLQLQNSIGENTDVKIIPYYWYGYGTGGNQQRLQTESAFLNPATGKNTAGVDLNGDGDTLDKVIVANSSVTRTNRPGITASVIHLTFIRYWLVSGMSVQHTSNMVLWLLDANGNAADIWLKDGRINRPNGTPFQSRDWKTISTAYQFFAQDTISLMNDKLSVNVGVRAPTMKRNFTNYGEGWATPEKSYSKYCHNWVPAIRSITTIRFLQVWQRT